MIEVTRETIRLPQRREDAHKGDFGRAFLICGSDKYTGAAFFAAQAAVNTGCGLVFLSVPDCIRAALSAKLNEPILLNRKEIIENDACLIGCGIGLGRKSEKLVEKTLFSNRSPLVCDADAITILAKKPKLLDFVRHSVLTPHEGEFRRLVPDFTHERREEFAINFAKAHTCILVLKGARTLTASYDGTLFVNTSGNAGMAKGGSGDVLSGIITSLIAQGIDPLRAAYTGVWLHGAAGDLASEMYGEYSMTPTDMLCTLKSVIKEVPKAQ